MYNINKIRNFSIIAHVDHGKSTLADRMIQLCDGIAEREMKNQILDSMDLERERGITIKAQTVRLKYKSANGDQYDFNLIDTPGHVDFSYEVSRSLLACEGSLLVIDASQGIEAQTLANVYKAIDANHEIITVFNKIDLATAEIDKISKQVEDIIGLDLSNSIAVSAKTGKNVELILEALINSLPQPVGNIDLPLRALLIDSWYDPYIGVVMLVRIIDGIIKKGMNVTMMQTKGAYYIDRLGCFTPKMLDKEYLYAGEIGFIIANVKRIEDARIGDTITNSAKPTNQALPGFTVPTPVIWSSLFPVDNSEYEKLKSALGKLSLNDSSISYQIEKSAVLGFGFRCGFLGLLHSEIIQERLMREFDIELIATAPSVTYEINLKDNNSILLQNPVEFPDASRIDFINEPWAKVSILTPEQYVGSILTLCIERRGVQISFDYKSNRVMLVYEIPLNELLFDFYDRLKSISSGYASFDYETIGYKMGDLVKVSVLVNSEPVEALSFIVHRNNAEYKGRAICSRLKELIPKQLFKIPIQAAINGKIIARETISALRKDVTAKCYGGDITRKRKLLEKQKKGKKRMRQFGNVEIPHNVFVKALRDTDS